MIPVNTPLFIGNEKKYLNDCIDSGWVSSEGQYVKKFEEALSGYYDKKYAVAVTNGSVALDLAVEALELSPGDEVILPSFTIISCLSPILRNNLIPVFVDQDISSWNMDVNLIEKLITPKTKAIMVVHIYGLPVEMDQIIYLAKKYSLKIIEDTAEVQGQEYKNKKCGSFGDVTTLSFYPNKHITTGEGGMVLTDNEEIYNKLCSLRNLCFNNERRFKHYDLGYNARMSNIQAAVGLAQFENISFFIKKKREIGRKYLELFKNLKGVQLPTATTDYAENIFWVFGIILDKKLAPYYKNIIDEINLEGIGTRPFFFPLHQQPVLKKYNLFNENIKLPNSELMSDLGFYIPSGLSLKEEEILKVSEVIIRIVTKYNQNFEV